MTKLSTFSRFLRNYLDIHGDKEVLSVAAVHGDKDCDFVVHMADIFDGPLGSNPYNGRDALSIPTVAARSKVKEDDIAAKQETGVCDTGYEAGYNDGYSAGYDMGMEYNDGYSTGYDVGVEHAFDDEEQVYRENRNITALFAVIFVLSVLNLVVKRKK